MPVLVDDLIPHHPPMRWIDSLLECEDTSAAARAIFSEGHFAVANGRISEAALIECMAQTVAAALGERARRSGHAGNAGIGHSGMLAAVSNFRIHSPAPIGKELRIEVRELKRLGPMLMVAGSVSSGAQIIAEGELTLYA